MARKEKLMNFKEFYFDKADEREMLDFVGAHWDFIFNVQYRGECAADFHTNRGWAVRVKFDNSDNVQFSQ